MFSSDTQSRGFATIAIIGGTVVAVAVGGVFYFLRSRSVEIDTALKEDTVAIVGDGPVLSVDAEQVLLRGLPRGKGGDYCSLLGLDRDSCIDGVGDVCRDLFTNCSIDTRVDDPDTFRQLAEACLVLRNPVARVMYFSWLDGDDSSPFPLYYALFGLSSDTFTQKDLSDAYQALLDTYSSNLSCDNKDVLRLFTEGYLLLTNTKGRSLYDAWLADGAAGSFPFYYAVFGLDRGAVTQQEVAAAYKDLISQYSLGQYGDSVAVLQLLTEAHVVLHTPDSLSSYNAVLDGSLSSVFSDVSFDLGQDDLLLVLRDLDLPPTNLGILLGSLNLPPSNLATLVGALNLSPSNLGTLLGSLNLPPSDLSALLGTLNLPLTGLGDLNLPPPFPPSGLPKVTIPEGGTGSDVATGSDLPVVTIFALAPGQIGVRSSVQPSFRITLTKNGSVYTPETPIAVALRCRQFVDTGQRATSLVSVALPSSRTLSTNSDTITLERNPDVTGSVRCTVVADTAVPATYVVGPSSSAAVTVVGGSSPPLCDRPSCDTSSDDSPSISITALESRIASGADAVFRVSANQNFFTGSLQVYYSCATSTDAVVKDKRYLDSQDEVLTIQGGSGGFFADITVETIAGRSGDVICSLQDGVGKYRIRSRDARVSVGLARLSDAAQTRGSSLPTVSLIAYQGVRDGGKLKFTRRVTDVVAGSDDVYFGFVIQDPALLSFGSEDPGVERKGVPDDGYLLYEDEYFKVSVTKDLTVNLVNLQAELGDNTEEGVKQVQEIVNDWWTTLGSGESRVVITKAQERVTMIEANETSTVCGRETEFGPVVCRIYPPHEGSETVLVNTRCFLEIPDAESSPDLGTLVGGRYLADGGYQLKVGKYDEDTRAARDPDGDLYQFVTPDGNYVSGPDRVVRSLGTSPFAVADSTFSCEIVGGGEEDGYTVGIGRVAVRVRPQPTVSLEGRGSRRSADDFIGDPVALVDRGQKNYSFQGKEPSDFSSLPAPLEDALAIPKNDASLTDVLVGLGASAGVGFLTSFGGCVGSSLVTSGIGALAEKLKDTAFASVVPVSDESLDTKECFLDAAVSGAAVGLLTGIVRDYITWAHEGFEGKPLFVRNPTTFYKNFHDEAIGRVIDRSGLGFLCDIGVGSIDPYVATLKIDLQQRYYGLAAERPRCTYTDLQNNLEEYFDDAQSFLSDFDDAYLKKLGFTIDGTASPQYGGTLTPLPRRSATGNQLDALSATLDRTLQQAADSNNILLALTGLDAAVNKAEQDFDAAAKPPSQVFNPSNPMSLAAFRECTEAENPEGDTDCFLLNVSGSQITEQLDWATQALPDRLKQVDEFGEMGQLVKMAVNATSAGLMKKYLQKGFGLTVGRETVDLLSDIESDFASSTTPYSTDTIDLGERWWSVFFDSNLFYNDVVSAEMYLNDVVTLSDYISSSLYEKFIFYDSSGISQESNLPPVGLYTAFYTLHDAQKACLGDASRHSPCANGYTALHDLPQSILQRHYNAVLSSSGDPDDGFKEGWLHRWFTRKGWVRGILDSMFQGEASEKKREGHKSEVVSRFKRAWRTLSNFSVRQEYNAFVADLSDDSDDGIEIPYSSKEGVGVWERNLPDQFRVDDDKEVPPFFQSLKVGAGEVIHDGGGVVSFPTHYDSLLEAYVTNIPEKVCTDKTSCGNCPSGLSKRPKVGVVGAACNPERRDGDSFYECLDPTLGHGQKASCVYSLGNSDVVLAICRKGLGHPAFWNSCGVCNENHDEFRAFNLANVKPEDMETYCPAHVSSPASIDARDTLVTLQKLRKIYEATLAVYVRLVGSVDEYAGSPVLDEHIRVYRDNIVSATNHTDRFSRWRAVQHATLKKFRDGTMHVYIPIDDGEFTEDEDTEPLLPGCSPPTNDVIAFNDGALIRRYKKMGCVLGTVSQDQAFFSVRRENDDLRESLPVYLACGYTDTDDDAEVTSDTPLQFSRADGNPRPYVVTLGVGEDAVIFAVPRPIYEPFDSGGSDDLRNAAKRRVRCSIDKARTNVFSDPSTDVVTVSDHSLRDERTFHAIVHTVLDGGDIPAIDLDEEKIPRVDQIASALFYTYMWGWYTGFLEMPYHSIQGLLSHPPVQLTDSTLEMRQSASENQGALLRYRLLSSLFVDESNPEFETKNFGFLTPQEAYDAYRYSYDDKFNAYFGRALGGFLELVPDTRF